VFLYKQFSLRIQAFDIDGGLVALKKNHSPLTIDYSVSVGAVNLRNGKYDETNSQHRESRIANHDLEANFFLSFLSLSFHVSAYLRIVDLLARKRISAIPLSLTCQTTCFFFFFFFFLSYIIRVIYIQIDTQCPSVVLNQHIVARSVVNLSIGNGAPW